MNQLYWIGKDTAQMLLALPPLLSWDFSPYLKNSAALGIIPLEGHHVLSIPLLLYILHSRN